MSGTAYTPGSMQALLAKAVPCEMAEATVQRNTCLNTGLASVASRCDTVARTLNSPAPPLALTRPPRAHPPESEWTPGGTSFSRSREAFPRPCGRLGDGPFTYSCFPTCEGKGGRTDGRRGGAQVCRFSDPSLTAPATTWVPAPLLRPG